MKNITKLLLYFIFLFTFEIVFIVFFSWNFRAMDFGIVGLRELIPLIPGGFISDLLIVFIVIPILIIVFGFLLSPLITIIYYGSHRLVRKFSKEYEYKLIKMRENIPFKRLFYRLIFPAFFSLSLAMIFNSTTSSSLFLQLNDNMVLQVYFASIIFALPAFLLLAPLWIMDDSGIICHLREDLGYRRPPESESISRLFSNGYKGYVGITFVFSFSLLLYAVIFRLLIDPRYIYRDIVLIVGLLGFPFALSATFAPFCILYEISLRKLVSFMHKVARSDKMPYVEEKFVKVEREGVFANN